MACMYVTDSCMRSRIIYCTWPFQGCVAVIMSASALLGATLVVKMRRMLMRMWDSGPAL